jgi:trk system potassium uptake protein
MYIIVVGAGATGLYIASLLVKAGEKVAIVEQSEEVAEHVHHQLDVGVVLGNSATPRVLRQVDVHRADLLVACTSSDETNIMTCIMAKELGAKKTVARVRNPEYSGYLVVGGAETPQAPRKVVRPKRLGIDLFVNPEIEAAKEIVSILSSLYATPVHEFANGRIQMGEFKVENEAAVVDKPIWLINDTLPRPCVATLIVRSGEVKIPNSDDIIRQGDRVYVIAAKEDMDELGSVFNHPKLPTKTVVILGGGYIGFRVAEELDKRGVQIKLIEKSVSRCQEISGRLKRVAVVQGQGTDRDLLTDEGVPSSDAFIATSGDEALNILAGLVAKNLGVDRNVVLVDNPEYIPLAQSVGIDVAVSPILLAGSRISRFILHSGAISTALLENEQAQAIEFIANSTAHITKGGGKGVKLPQGAIMGAIIRGDMVIIPPGDNAVQPGDHVVVVSLPSVISSVEKLFK